MYQKIVNGSSIIRTDYFGDLIYKNDTLISILHDEGKIRFDEQGLGHYQYFITDHLGNTRVIFEKLNDSVYLAQENHYGVWGEVLQGIETSGDWKFLFQGKEYVDAFGLNEYDFHARGYDAWAGRFNGVDPVSNYSLSGYAGMVNNPTAYIDPDGRNPIAIGFMIGMGISAISHMIKGTMPKNIGQFLAPGVVGAVGGAFGALAPNPLITGLGKNIAYGAFSGGVTGGISDLLNGGNGSGVLWGALSGGAFGGIGWGIQNNQLNSQLHNRETALAFSDDPKYVSKTRPMVHEAGIYAPRLKQATVIAPPLRPVAIPGPTWFGRVGTALSRFGGALALAFTVSGDVPLNKRPSNILLYRNMGEAEYNSFMRKGMNFGTSPNSLDVKEFWMSPDGLAHWNTTPLSGPYNVTVAIPSRLVGPHGIIQPQVLDGHMAGVVYPHNLNNFNRAKVVLSVIKR